MKKLLSLFILLTIPSLWSNAQTVNNASFENWHNYTVSSAFNSYNFQAPNNWSGGDSAIATLAPLALLGGYDINVSSQVFPDSAAHDGIYSARLVTSIADSTDTLVIPGMIVNSPLNLDMTALITALTSSDTSSLADIFLNAATGGTSVSSVVDSVSAWVKTSALSDSGHLVVAAYKTVQSSIGADSQAIIGEGNFTFGADTTFHRIVVPITYSTSEIPERIVIMFTSAASFNESDSQMNKSWVNVDDVSLIINNPTGINNIGKNKLAVSVFPNPALDGLFNFKIPSTTEKFSISVTDVLGKQIFKSIPQNNTNYLLNLNGFSNGMYFYQISNNDGIQMNMGKLIKQ